MEEISVARRLDILRGSSIFTSLPDMELSIIADYSDIAEVRMGDALFYQGSRSEHCYIIIEGEVVILRDSDAGDIVDVARFLEGDSFGEMDLLGGTPHAANAIATKNCRMLVFPAKGRTLENILAKHPFIASHILQKLMGIIAGRIRSTNNLISDRTPWIGQLRRQLYTDKLTGLYNKMFLDDELDDILHRNSSEYALLIIKPDNFKDVNDTFGHEVGDRVLRMIAIFLSSIPGEDDLCIRYRGDEFALLMARSGYNEAKKTAEDVIKVFSEIDIAQITGDDKLDFVLSIGIAFSGDDITGQQLIAQAYDNMIKARSVEGNSTVSEE